MRTTIAVLSLLAAACAAPAPEPEPNPDTAVSSADAPAPTSSATSPTAAPTAEPAASGTKVATLEGEWRVAGIDGGGFNEPYGIALSADTQKIWWEPACAGQDRHYTIEGLRFEPTNPDVGIRTVCEIGLPERLPDVWRAIDAADRIERTASNGVLLSGGGHSVLLFSQ